MAVPVLHRSETTLAGLGPWEPAQRYWRGNAPELDIVARSADGRRLLVGEAKWSMNTADASGAAARGDVGNPVRGDVGNPARGDVGNPARGDVGNPARGDVGNPARDDVGNPARDDVGNLARAIDAEVCRALFVPPGAAPRARGRCPRHRCACGHERAQVNPGRSPPPETARRFGVWMAAGAGVAVLAVASLVFGDRLAERGNPNRRVDTGVGAGMTGRALLLRRLRPRARAHPGALSAGTP